MPTVIYNSPFVPAEWIAAHGLTPRRLIPAGGGGTGVIAAIAGVCPFMRAFVNEACVASGATGLVLASTCDQMRRARDHVETWSKLPVFLMNIPSTWRTPAAHAIYQAELRRLGSFLIQLGGKSPARAKLRAVMTSYDRRRAAARARRAKVGGGIPLALIGGPLSARDGGLVGIIEQAGGVIALDATENGERAWPPPFDRRRLRADPFGELATAYFEGIPDVFQRPNARLHAWLAKATREAGARGVIVLRQVWCDKWHAEVARLRETLALPLLDLDLDGDDLPTRHRLRLQAFLEGLA
jgi:benzoyl-CoA reductase/2-hydroxyglutaryl-CoA dehydratase subunit BcrC/BadD/HgdB